MIVWQVQGYDIAMVKILAPVIVLIVIVTAFVFIKFGSSPISKSVSLNPVPVTTSHETGASEATTSSNPLASATNLVVTQTNNSSLEARVNTLEAAVSVLQRRVDFLEKNSRVTVLPNNTTTTTSTTVTKSAPVYIPLGSEGSVTSQTYINLDTFAVSIDPTDYPGQTSVSLELSMAVPAIVATGYARLYDATDGKDISGSEVSSTSGSYALLSSNGFSLSSGKKTYYLQARSSNGDIINIQNARLKVSF